MLFNCPKCNSGLEYTTNGTCLLEVKDRNDLWKYFDLIPLEKEENIVSLGVGDSQIIPLEELGKDLNDAQVFLMCDHTKNPTGTFKDREASIIMSRCKELGLNNLVFYSTANTGRAYTHFAAHLGLTTFMFMPTQCAYKNTNFIRRNPNNFIIYVDDQYSEISPYTKEFAKLNNLTPIAPMHDRTESYATVAYEQFRQLPDCDYFVQTIASGMGPIGFYKGHQNLVNLGLQKKDRIPKIICVQTSQLKMMSHAYNTGAKKLTKEDMPKDFPENLFEPTLNSTNPVNNYPHLYSTLQANDGIITDVEGDFTMHYSEPLIRALKKRNIFLRDNLEKSLLIEYAGLIKLSRENQLKKGAKILMLACGRGKDDNTELLKPDAIINPNTQNPVELFKKLQHSKN